MKIHLFLLTLLTFIAVSACKDDKKQTQSACETNPGSCQKVKDAKDFFYFNYGSWWVYEEQTTHVRDSMYVTYSNNTNGYDFDVKIKSALSGYEYHFWPKYYQNVNGCSQNNFIPSTSRCIFIERSKYNQAELFAESKLFFVSYKQGDFIYTGGNVNQCENSKLTIGQIHESYSLNALNFNKTIELIENCSQIEGKVKAAIASSVGGSSNRRISHPSMYT